MAQFAVVPKYEIWLGNQTGERQYLIKEVADLQVALGQNGQGTARIAFSGQVNNKEFNYDLLQEDGWLEIWRRTNLSPARLVADGPFLLQEDIVSEDSRGTSIELVGSAAGRIMSWPIVAYDAGSSQSAKTDNGDDMIKEIAAENVSTSASDSDRDMSSYLQIEADASEGASLTKAFARRKLSDVFTEICEYSAQQGTRLYWDVVWPNPGSTTSKKLELRTYKGQRGEDRGLNVTNPLYFSISRGNLKQITRTRSYADVVNYAYALGQGTESARNVQEASDSSRIANSPWGRIKEGTVSATQSNTDNGVLAEARALIREKRPRIILEAQIQDTPGTQFGVHWGYGDLVVVEAFGQRYEAIISPIQIHFSGGRESITANLRVEE